MSLLLMASRHSMIRAKRNEEHLKDNGTCQNCKHQGKCPYADGVCSSGP